MTKSQAKAKCKRLHKGKRTPENYFLIKYSTGWTIGTPEEYSTSNKKALDFELYTL